MNGLRDAEEMDWGQRDRGQGFETCWRNGWIEALPGCAGSSVLRIRWRSVMFGVDFAIMFEAVEKTAAFVERLQEKFC